MRTSGKGNKNGEMGIDRRIAKGLAISLIGHGLLIWLFAQWPHRTPGTPAVALHVELAPTPVAPPPAPQPVEANPPPPPATLPARDATTRAHDWQRTAAEVVATMSARPQSLFAPVPSSAPARQDEAAPSRFPAVGEAFGPMPRSRKICGRMVNFQFGVHRISMPTSYVCEDKEDEYRTAPAAGRDIGNPVQQ